MSLNTRRRQLGELQGSRQVQVFDFDRAISIKFGKFKQKVLDRHQQIICELTANYT